MRERVRFGELCPHVKRCPERVEKQSTESMLRDVVEQRLRAAESLFYLDGTDAMHLDRGRAAERHDRHLELAAFFPSPAAGRSAMRDP